MRKQLDEQQRLNIEALCDAAERFMRATNDTHDARHPEDHDPGRGELMDLETALEQQSEAWSALHRAVYYARKNCLGRVEPVNV